MAKGRKPASRAQQRGVRRKIIVEISFLQKKKIVVNKRRNPFEFEKNGEK